MLQKNIALWLSRKLYILQISATTKDLVLQVPPDCSEAHTGVGKFMKYCETAGLRKESVLQQEVSEQG